MNRKELKKMIRGAALAQMPDVIDKIDLAGIDVPEAPVRDRRHLPRFSFAFALKAALVLLLAAVTGIFVYDRFLVEPPVVLALDTEAEVYGFQMVSATSLLAQFADADIALALAGAPGHNTTTESGNSNADALIAAKVQRITEYLNTMEVMLAERDETVYAVVPSDVAGFAWKLTFTTVDLLNNALSYEIFYNETADPEDAARRIVEGVMTMGENEYTLSGTVTTDGETVRTHFIATSGNDAIEITDLTDATGQKYRYEVTKDGAAYETMTMKLGLEDDNLVATITATTATESYEFKFRKNDDGTGFQIRYRYEVGGETETGRMDAAVEYDEVEAAYMYRYSVDAETGPHQGHSDQSGNRTDKTNGNGHGRGRSDSENV